MLQTIAPKSSKEHTVGMIEEVCMCMQQAVHRVKCSKPAAAVSMDGCRPHRTLSYVQITALFSSGGEQIRLLPNSQQRSWSTL
ncbi:hypothetical protein WAI453_007259 [Rhynchosporium graminicola]